MSLFSVIVIVLAAMLVSGLVSGFYFSSLMHKKLTYMLDALEDKEMNFRFSENKLYHRRFNKTLNRIRTIFDQEKKEISEQEQYFGKMLNQVKTGIIVVDFSEKRKGNVIYSNSSALDILGLSVLNHIRQIGLIDKELENSFWDASTSINEKRNSFYNEKGKITVLITATETQLQKKEVRIVSINDITGDVAHNEELSWNKLIRVLTHEIMNTVTPIASLSDTLSEDIKTAKDLNHLNIQDLKIGLDTIADSSKGLIKFVDSYRSLTRVSPPEKKAFYVRDLIEKVQHLTREQVCEAGALFDYEEKSDDILLYADQNQISQVIINLVKNALQAGAGKIKITASIDHAECVVIMVSNNGRPITKENQDEIFVPFYTTKQEGTGIGLSLSRQIMRLHNGSIQLIKSDSRITTFCLYFK